MRYILLKGSNDQSRVAVSQELKRLRKRVKELEENQKATAIQELMELRVELVNKASPVLLSYTDYVQQVYAKIDNRIKQLEGENNENI